MFHDLVPRKHLASTQFFSRDEISADFQNDASNFFILPFPLTISKSTKRITNTVKLKKLNLHISSKVSRLILEMCKNNSIFYTSMLIPNINSLDDITLLISLPRFVNALKYFQKETRILNYVSKTRGKNSKNSFLQSNFTREEIFRRDREQFREAHP